MNKTVWKIIKTIAFIIFICGFILMFGIVGTEDYYAEIGQKHDVDLFHLIMSVLMLIPFGIVMMTDNRMD